MLERLPGRQQNVTPSWARFPHLINAKVNGRKTRIGVVHYSGFLVVGDLSSLYQVRSCPGEVVTMVGPSTVAKITDAGSHGSDHAESPPTTAPRHASSEPLPAACTGRGVLDGAFAVLEALADTDDGLGLSALAKASGLAKTSAYRLAEQLVALGAVQRVDHRYYIGARIGHMGQRWQPDPVLRQAAAAPVHILAVQSRATATLRILHEARLRVICTTAPHGHAYLPNPADRESTARTATGRVLYASTARSDVALPGCWTPREWRQLRESIGDAHATVIDHQDAFPGVCCVSAPVWWPNGACAGAVTVVLQAAKPPANLRELVVCAARNIGAGLR
jgi:DNA-binding IclR family transcriptional regulator